MQCSIECALSRNSVRESPIPSLVLKETADKLELPDAHSKHSVWEDNAVFLNTEHGEIDCALVWSQLVMFFNSALPEEPDNSQKEASRQACSTNVAHQFDLFARKIISFSLASTAHATAKAAAPQLSELKARFLVGIVNFLFMCYHKFRN